MDVETVSRRQNRLGESCRSLPGWLSCFRAKKLTHPRYRSCLHASLFADYQVQPATTPSLLAWMFLRSAMKTLARTALVIFLLAVTAHRLPAPIQEVPESPTPVPEQSAKPKPKPKPLPKPKSEASESATNPVRQEPSTKPSRFAGTWVGTMPTIPWGNLESVLTVDSTETSMAVSWYEADEPGDAKTHKYFKAAPASARGHAAAKPAFAKAQLNGDTLAVTFPAALLGTSKWSIIPQPDGTTARVRMQAFMNDFTAVFHRTVSESSAAKPAR
jgi:hypothetical protein